MPWTMPEISWELAAQPGPVGQSLDDLIDVNRRWQAAYERYAPAAADYHALSAERAAAVERAREAGAPAEAIAEITGLA